MQVLQQRGFLWPSREMQVTRCFVDPYMEECLHELKKERQNQSVRRSAPEEEDDLQVFKKSMETAGNESRSLKLSIDSNQTSVAGTS